MPGSSVSAIQIAAHKKLVLVNLILTGKVRRPPIVTAELTSRCAGNDAPEIRESAGDQCVLDVCRRVCRVGKGVRGDGPGKAARGVEQAGCVSEGTSGVPWVIQVLRGEAGPKLWITVERLRGDSGEKGDPLDRDVRQTGYDDARAQD